MKKKYSLILGLLVLLGLWYSWKNFASSTKIALYNFSEEQVANISLSNKDKSVKFVRIARDDLKKLKKFDMILGYGLALRINEEQKKELKTIARKIPTHFIMAFDPELQISTLGNEDLEKVSEYLDNGNRKNYQNFARYVRKYIDKKKIFVHEPEAAIQSKKEVFFHLDESIAYEKVQDYEDYLKKEGIFKPGASKVAIIAGIHDSYSGDKQFLDSLITAFQNKNFNVYPIASSDDRLALLDQVNPDAVVYFPHGRLLMSESDKAVEWFKEKNIPFYTPLTVLQTREDWEKDEMGMFGGFMGQTIVMPELDGALYPYVLFARYKTKGGLYLLRAIPERLKNFTQIVENQINLKKLANKDKKVAIYYFKDDGQNTLNAQGLETTASLYNVLKRLKAEGYTINNLPGNDKELAQLINQQGNIYNPRAKGAIENFIKNGKPIMVEAEKYNSWLKSRLTEQDFKEVGKIHGDVSESFMSTQKNGKDYLAVAGIQLGNIVLLPQPAAALDEETFAMNHGVKEIPPHSYIGSYLWVQNEFKADALLHFGTHGSLEFTPTKQVALSQNDWPELLVGNVPHFYYYTIGNVGESMMAKRRTYATTISYLTPAFVESELRTQYAGLQESIRDYYTAADPQKEKKSLEVKKLTINLGLHRYLKLDSLLSKPYAPEDIVKIENFAEEISNEKINGELYTATQPYSTEKINSTVMAMSAEPLAYSLASLDKLRGKTTEEKLKNHSYFSQNYLNQAKNLVREILNGKTPDHALLKQFAQISDQEIEAADKALTKPKMPNSAAFQSPKEKAGSRVPYFIADQLKERGYDVNSDFIPKEEIETVKADWGKMPGFVQKKLAKDFAPLEDIIAMIEKNNKGRTPSEKPKAGKPSFDPEDKEKAEAIVKIRETLENVVFYKKGLLDSPELEMKALLNGLNGGYIPPSSGGDAVANPQAVPTGHNMYAVNAENTPSKTAWKIGKKLAENTINEYRKNHKTTPKKIAFTFWSGEFIETQGVSIAQVFHLLGVEPVWDSFGRVNDIRLISSKELGRPRVDIVIQTSGQFRDLAASRMILISKAINLAASAKDDDFDNHVREGTLAMEKDLVSKGVPPSQARKLSTRRIFGGLEGAYSTGIQSLIQAGDQWDTDADIAQVYLNNMGASYDDDQSWGEFQENIFQAALQNTDVLVQPRQNNTWGALSLDHVYEFMGGLNTAIKQVTGKNPEAYMADYRNHYNMRMQELNESVGVEASSTIFNPNYIKEVMKGKASSANQISNIAMNMYGWNATRESVIDQGMWDEFYDTYIDDKYNLNIQNFFMSENAASLQTTTSVMMEAARKKMWNASPEQLKQLADLSLELNEKLGAESSSFLLNNEKLQDFIAQQMPEQDATAFRNQISQAKESNTEIADNGQAQVLKKQNAEDKQESINLENLWVAGIVLAVFIALIFVLNKRRKNNN